MDGLIYLIAMVMNLMNNKKWEEFVLEDVFDLFTGALIPSEIIEHGYIPKITATDNNNGIATFTNHINHRNFRVFKNFISISFLGSVYYQKGVSSLDMKIHGIKPKEVELDEGIALFLIPLLRNFTSKYSYGNQLSMRLLRRQKIKLPLTNQGNIDWLYMSSVGDSIFTKQRNDLLDHITKKYSDLKREKELFKLVKLKKTNWSPIEIKDVFKYIRRGKRLTKANQIKGHVPYVSSTSLNNGVDNFIGNDKGVRSSGYDVTIANSGSVGNAFYHDYEYIASDHVHSLSNEKFNKYHYLFLVTMLNRLQEKYHFNREINQKRLNKEKIMLPVDDKGVLNLEFMELYIKKIEYEKLGQVIAYLKGC